MDRSNNEHLSFKLASFYRYRGKYDLALREYERLITIEPQKELALLELGKLYKMTDRCPEAIEKFIEVININPNNKEALIELGDTARVSNNYDPAIGILTEVLEKTPENEQAHIELSKLYQEKGYYDKAFEKFKSALKINPRNSGIYVSLGQIYKAKGKKKKAIEEFKQAIEIKPDDKDAHAELGEIYMEQNNLPAAVDEFKSAADISPSDIKLRLNLIKLYAQMNKQDLCDREIEKSLQLAAGNPFLRDAILNDIEIIQKKTILKSKVKRLWVTVTTRCNIKCRTCGLWSTSPWDIPEKTAREVMELFPYLERVVWLGGEVFLYKLFSEIFDKALAFPNIQHQIITNGVILNEEWIKKIVKTGAELTISVDGVTKEVYEYIRRGAKFEKLVQNIKLAQEFIKKYNSRTKMRLNALIMKSNYRQIEQFLDFAHEFGFVQVSLLALHFDEDPKENIFYVKKNHQALEYITKAIPGIRQKAKDYNIDLDILLPTEDLKFDAFENKTETQPAVSQQPQVSRQPQIHCKMPWKYMFICDKGTVYLTGSCQKPIGNIHENSIDEIWNSPEAQLYRESMLKNEFQELCRPECMTRWEV